MLLIMPLFRFNTPIKLNSGVSYCRRLLCSASPKIKYGGKLKSFTDLCDHYLSVRKVNAINEQMFEQLIVDDHSRSRVREVLSKYHTLKEGNQLYPSDIAVDDMKYMIGLTESKYVAKHLRFLFVREFDIWRAIQSKMSRHIEREKQLKWEKEELKIGVFDEHNSLQYGFWRNHLFSRYFDNSLRTYSLHNLRSATLFGQKLVVDCSFDESMADYEVGSAYRQMKRIYSHNRYSSLPYDLHFCNCHPDSRVIQRFFKSLKPGFPHYLNIHEESYLELFANYRLIYLSPDSSKTMSDYDENAIYILGSLVGKTCALPITNFKARVEGIECYKLPINTYVTLRPGVKKVLSFESVFNVLNEFKVHRDWKRALSNGIQEHKLVLPQDNVEDVERVEHVNDAYTVESVKTMESRL